MLAGNDLFVKHCMTFTLLVNNVQQTHYDSCVQSRVTNWSQGS